MKTKIIRKEGERIGTVQRLCQNKRQEVHDDLQEQVCIRTFDI